MRGRLGSRKSQPRRIGIMLLRVGLLWSMEFETVGMGWLTPEGDMDQYQTMIGFSRREKCDHWLSYAAANGLSIVRMSLLNLL